MNHWSHSSINEILNNPASFYLSHVLGIEPKEKKKPFVIGSAVHYALEMNNSNLEQYFKDEGLYFNRYEDYMILSEVMAEVFLTHKKEFLKQILGDEDILLEEHELELIAPLKSRELSKPNNFLGIIDLMFVTNKGIVIIDYKTSSAIPDWNGYLEQLYRYIFLAKHHFPEMPVYKIGIINLRKSPTRMLNGESPISYRNRLLKEYERDNTLINIHVYDPKTLDEETANAHIEKLERDADKAELIYLNNLWQLNESALITKYGKCEFYDVFTNDSIAYVKYTIKDKIYDSTLDKYLTKRDCKPIDMLVLKKDNILNKYEAFKIAVLGYYAVNKRTTKEVIFEFLKKSYITDDELLELYWKTFEKDLKEDIF